MANRYWVGGTGNWSDATLHWASSSGGLPLITNLPTFADNVFIDSNSGLSGGTISIITTPALCHDFISDSGLAYSIASNTSLNILGSLTLENTITAISNGTTFSFGSSSTGETITTAGVPFPSVIFSGSGEWTIQDNLTIESGCSISVHDGSIINNGTISSPEITIEGGMLTLGDDLTLTGEFSQNNGTFDANDHNVTANNFYFYADMGHTPTVIMGSGTWEATGGDWYIYENNAEVVTVTPETSTIKMSGGGYFGTSNKTYNNLWFTTSGLITGSNTFNDLKIDAGLTISFKETSTQTVSSFTATGTSGNLIVLKTRDGGGVILTATITDAGEGYSVNQECGVLDGGWDGLIKVTSVNGSGGVTGFTILNGGHGYTLGDPISLGGGTTSCVMTLDSITVDQFTLSKSSGTVVCDYLDLSNSNAIGGATWYAGSNSADTTNNDGWLFSPQSPSVSSSPSSSVSPSSSLSSSPSQSISSSPSRSVSSSPSPPLETNLQTDYWHVTLGEIPSISSSPSASVSSSPSTSVSSSPSASVSPSTSESSSPSTSVSSSPSTSTSSSASSSPSRSLSSSPSRSISASVSSSPSSSTSISLPPYDGTLYRWDGSAWDKVPLYVWDGSAWNIKAMYWWDATSSSWMSVDTTG
jgi:acetyltransferase-like isoleucine patch superfamily enzyme